MLPAIIIGYGRIGHMLLRRLLVAGAERGSLDWTKTAGGGREARRLRDLAFLWIPDKLKLPTQAVKSEEDSMVGGQFDINDDLYRYIKKVDIFRVECEVEEVAKRLLDANHSRNRSGDIASGLDVFFLAQVDQAAVVGEIDSILRPLVDRLAGMQVLQQPIQGGDVLNFIEVLDFDDFYRDDRKSSLMRRAVYSSIQAWADRKTQGEQSFGRIYISDSAISHGHRSEIARVDELVLTLEFMLFATPRGTFPWLHRPSSVAESPLCSIGVRVMEHSTSRVGRLAAAYFGMNWLAYMTGSDGELKSRRVGDAIYMRLEEDKNSITSAWKEIVNEVDREALRIEKMILDRDPSSDDWILQISEHLESMIGEASKNMSVYLADVDKSLLSSAEAAHDTLVEDITELLHHPEEPVTIEALLSELRERRKRLREEVVSKGERGIVEMEGETAPIEQLRSLHWEFLEFRDRQLNVDRMMEWGIWLGVACALVFTPIMSVGVRDWSVGVSSPPWLRLVNSWVVGPAGGLVISLLFALVVFAFVAVYLRWAWAYRIERGLSFYLDRRRGRFAARVRSLLGPGGALRRRFDAADSHPDEAINRLRLAIAQRVDRAILRLEERRYEMVWLRKQLREYLVASKVSIEGSEPNLLSADDRLRYRTRNDLAAVLEKNPATKERFCSEQSRLKPFKSWSDRYCPSFLYPLDFLEVLIGEYHKSIDEQEGGRRNFELFLKSHEVVPAFRWLPREDIPSVRMSCVMPEPWFSWEDARGWLIDQGVGEDDIHAGWDHERGYLISTVIGVNPERLLKENGELR